MVLRPAFGRFITPDPIGFAGGLNPYGYPGNDPVGGIDPTGLYSFRGWQSDFSASVQVVHDFGYNNRYWLGPVAGAAAGTLTLDPVVGFGVGALVSGHLSAAGGEDASHVVADAFAGGTGAGALGELAAQGSAGLQFHFGSEEPEAVSCSNGSVTLSGSKGGEASSEADEFVVRRYMNSSQYKAARKGGIFFDPQVGSGIPTTSASQASVNPDYVRKMTGAASADFYIDFDARGLDYLRRDTKLGWPEYVIRGDLTPDRILDHGRVPKSPLSR